MGVSAWAEAHRRTNVCLASEAEARIFCCSLKPFASSSFANDFGHKCKRVASRGNSSCFSEWVAICSTQRLLQPGVGFAGRQTQTFLHAHFVLPRE